MKILAMVVGFVVCPLFGAEITHVYADGGGFISQTPVEQVCERSGGLSVYCHASAGGGVSVGAGEASASAYPGYVSVTVGTIATGYGGSLARASARDESFYIIWGSGTIDMTGVYLWPATCCFDTQEISQNGSATPVFFSPGYNYVTSTVQRGIPFEVVLQVSVSGAAGGMLTGMQRFDQLQFIGFFDDNGDPVPYSYLPEPGTFLPLAAALTALAIGRKRRRYAARPKCV